MIYKFIDNNGSEITVNSLSSIKGLIESETIKENTKVKAGLRGKWTTANKVEELKEFFNKQEETAPDVEEPQEDIKSFIIQEDAEKKKSKPKPEPEPEPEPEPKKEKILNTPPQVKAKYETEKVTKAKKTDSDLKSDEELEEEEKNRDKTYDDDNVIGLNFFQAVKTCLKKYFNFRDRASRSEYWYFQLLVTPVYLFSYIPTLSDETWIFLGLFFLITLIPSFAVAVRRFHDIDKSGWFILISIIPLVGWIIMLVMLVGKGTEGKNRFGDYPLELKKQKSK
tara:strand:+ start:241 stop:1083 length:843 start_codon:yes stop_codon:yes gene_type:complete